ncbi:MAG: aspartate carbamoyltransferase catalytic subunit [Desulfotomaculales bacterium]
MRHLLGLRELAPETIELILSTAAPMKEILGREIKKVPALRGKTVATLFYEPSTRTRMSFELAAKYLSADTVGMAAATSSVAKGESLLDTIRTVKALGADIVVLRHPSPGAAHLAARVEGCSIVNAGDGTHEHPTQALLDLFTIREIKGRIAGLTVVIVGDILHSRVARSNIWGLTRLGARVRVVGPATLIPPGLEQVGVEVFSDLREAVRGSDVIYVLRIQRERLRQAFFPSLREYTRLYAVTAEILALAKPDAIVMHPGPMNRGVEIWDEVCDSSRAVITTQVTNGVAVRMAVLYLLAGGEVKRDHH